MFSIFQQIIIYTCDADEGPVPTILFQNQWFCQRRYTSSIGTCFVSGRKKKMKALMMKIKPPNSKKIPYLR
jgi:hypothetical protein